MAEEHFHQKLSFVEKQDTVPQTPQQILSS